MLVTSDNSERTSVTPYNSGHPKEKGFLNVQHVHEDSDQDYYTDIEKADSPQKVVRGLRSRHIQLIALGSAIGTGLFIGSGGALSTCGPAPLFMAYIIISFFVWTIMNQLTEMVCLIPLPGEASIYSLTKTYMNSSISFMSGWNLFYAMAMIVPTEITACALLIKYWTDANSAIFITIFIVVSICLTMLPVRAFGESEFYVCTIKIVTIIGLIIIGIVIFFGGGPNQHHVLGFHYWKTPGAFQEHLASGSTGKFLAVWTAIIKSGFSFVLVPETVTSCSAECVMPRRNMPRACQRFVYRLAVFYVLGTLIIGVIVGSDNDRLINAIQSGKSDAAASPFVIGIQEVGIKVLPHIINACILTSTYSCGCALLFGSSRTIYAMALKGDAPKIFGKVNRFGTPYYSVGAASLFTFLAYLNCSKSSSKVFNWLSNIATISGFVSWIFVAATYLRFRRVMDILNLNDRVPFRVPYQRAFAWATGIFFFILSLTNGYSVFISGNWNVSDFFAAYVTIGFMIVLFVIGTVYHREWKFRDPYEIETEILPKIAISDEEERNEVIPVPKNLWEKIVAFII